MPHDAHMTELEQLIERIAYPVETDALIDFVREHGRGDGVVDLASRLPHQRWDNAAEIRQALAHE